MKKRAFALLLCGLLLVAGVGSARSITADYGTAVIDGGSADRVHLRELPSADAESLGLYFTGTQVLCASDPNDEWVFVGIGTQGGYMKSAYLRTSGSVSSKQPRMTVNAKGWVNLREEPAQDAAVAGRLDNGDTVTLLGETSRHWCYVDAGTQLGYVMAEFLTQSDEAIDVPAGYQMLRYPEAPAVGGSVSIQYPQFAGMDALNQLVYAKVASLPQFAEAKLTMELEAAVTLQTERFVSVVFWGTSNVEGSAHPNTELFALNVDLTTMREVTLAELYTLDADFERVFFAKAYFPTAPVTSYDAALFPEMLALQTTEYQTVSPFSIPESVNCFLKPDGIVISLPSMHATGSDHFEAQLDYADIASFRRLSVGVN